MHAAVCTQWKYSSKLNLSCLFYPFCPSSISPSLSTDPASTIIICLFILLSPSSVVTVPQTSSSPSLLLPTGSGSGGRTSSSCWPPLTTRGAELTTKALFVDWEAECGLVSSILEQQGHRAHYRETRSQIYIFFGTMGRVSSNIPYINTAVQQPISSWAGCYCRRALLFLPSISPAGRFSASLVSMYT